jgi:ribosomal 30S subunit maturation factor RimM
VVDRLIETGANAVLIVKDAGDSKAQERLIPFVGEIVKEIVASKAGEPGRIVVDWGLDW